jgi:hypothetical protein
VVVNLSSNVGSFWGRLTALINPLVNSVITASRGCPLTRLPTTLNLNKGHDPSWRDKRCWKPNGSPN